MVNNNNKKFIVKSKSGRRSNGRRARVPRPNSLFSGAYRTIIRVMWDVGSGADTDGNSFSANIDVGYVVPQGHAGLATIFKSVRVHSMQARFFPAIVKMSQCGFIAMNFGDIDETPTSTTIPGILASPGNSIGLSGSTVRGRWYPTEPSDREYIDMVNSKSHTWARLNLGIWPPKDTEWFSAKEAKTHLYGKVIVDVDCTFRGQGAKLASTNGICICSKCKGRLSLGTPQRRHVVINGILEEILPTSTCYDEPGTSTRIGTAVNSPPGEDFENLDLSSN